MAGTRALPRRESPPQLRRHQPADRASGRKKTITARYVHNDRLVDALNGQAFAALTASLGARAYYDQQRAAGRNHHDALRRLANRLVGILHGCLKTRTRYNENTTGSNRPLDTLSPWMSRGPNSRLVRISSSLYAYRRCATTPRPQERIKRRSASP